MEIHRHKIGKGLAMDLINKFIRILVNYFTYNLNKIKFEKSKNL